jgi:hypothetical protein
MGENVARKTNRFGPYFVSTEIRTSDNLRQMLQPWLLRSKAL